MLNQELLPPFLEALYKQKCSDRTSRLINTVYGSSGDELRVKYQDFREHLHFYFMSSSQILSFLIPSLSQNSWQPGRKLGVSPSGNLAQEKRLTNAVC